MFNRAPSVLFGRTHIDATIHQRSEVHEHRAPTDASVKLLREMEAAALNAVLGTYVLEGAPVHCVIHHMRDLMVDRDKFALRYKLGSQERVVHHTIDPGPAFDVCGPAHKHRVVKELVDVLANDIASQVLSKCANFGQLLRQIG